MTPDQAITRATAIAAGQQRHTLRSAALDEAKRLRTEQLKAELRPDTYDAQLDFSRSWDVAVEACRSDLLRRRGGGG